MSIKAIDNNTLTIFRAGGDPRSLAARVWHTVKAIFIYITLFFQKMGRKITALFVDPNIGHQIPYLHAGTWHFDLTRMPWNEGPSEGLSLFIHGLGARPSRWNSYLSDMKKAAPGAHHIAPFVPRKGHCSVEEAASPFLELVCDYVSKHPGKPIHLIGFSNGARIASYIEGHLHLERGSLSVISIAGPHHGSSMLTVARRVNALRLLGHPIQLTQEIMIYSATSGMLLDRARRQMEARAARGIAVEHIYYGSTEDEVIQPIGSALPHMEGALYRVLHGYPHSSLIEATRSEVVSYLTRRLRQIPA